MSLSNDLTLMLCALIGILVICAMVGVIVFQAKALRKCSEQLNGLGEKLDIFVETSMHVSRSVDHLVRQPDIGIRGVAAKQASRRWLLQEAVQRSDSSHDLEEVAQALGLSVDERSLLDVRRRRK